MKDVAYKAENLGDPGGGESVGFQVALALMIYVLEQASRSFASKQISELLLPSCNVEEDDRLIE